ncbi:MAG: hypothetical protein SGILL_007483, partial [Bacillariaceae sp.]
MTETLEVVSSDKLDANGGDGNKHKYTEAYFEKRIQTLQDKLHKALPTQGCLDPGGTFVAVIQSLQSSIESLDAASTLLETLEKEAEEHKDDGVDQKIIDQAKEAVEKAQNVKNKLSETSTAVGCNIIQTSNLLQSLRNDCGCTRCDLLESTVLVQSTPIGLAAWCAQDATKNQMLLDAFLGDAAQMEAFLIAGGPVRGCYGPALSILHNIQEEMELQWRRLFGSERDQSAVASRRYLLDRLALAVALEHASPIQIFKSSDQVIDPIQRFWHYADAHLEGALDDAFEDLAVWEMRLVVDSNATHSDLTWGRDFLKAYRPDEIWIKDEKWRYNRAVRTDVGYRHPDHDFSNYKDLISAGGECGARAWFGRFMCKAWGIPT